MYPLPGELRVKGLMSTSTSALGPPPRSHSLRNVPENPKSSDAGGRQSSSTTSEYYDGNEGHDSSALIDEAEEALARVERRLERNRALGGFKKTH